MILPFSELNLKLTFFIPSTTGDVNKSTNLSELINNSALEYRHLSTHKFKVIDALTC